MPGTRYFVLAAAYYAALSVISHIPGTILTQVRIEIWDKASHALAYAILGLLLALGFSKALRDTPRGLVYGVTLTAVLVLGGLDEFHQLFVTERFASAGDVVADVCGGALGLLVLTAVRRWWTRKKDTVSPRP